jgi:uncharacterized membrane protein
MEARVVEASVEDAKAARTEAKRGQYFGLVFGIFAISGAVTVVYMVPTGIGATVAGIIGGGTVVTIATAFILGRMVRSHAEKTAERVTPQEKGSPTQDITKIPS